MARRKRLSSAAPQELGRATLTGPRHLAHELGLEKRAGPADHVLTHPTRQLLRLSVQATDQSAGVELHDADGSCLEKLGQALTVGGAPGRRGAVPQDEQVAAGFDPRRGTELVRARIMPGANHEELAVGRTPPQEGAPSDLGRQLGKTKGVNELAGPGLLGCVEELARSPIHPHQTSGVVGGQHGVGRVFERCLQIPFGTCGRLASQDHDAP